MQRSSVDLPEPDAPIRQTTSCAATVEVDLVQHLDLAEALGDVLDRDEVRRSSSSSACGPLAPLALPDEAVGEARERDREDDEEHRRNRVAGEVEVVGGVEARLRTASVTPMTEMIAVSFCSPMKSFSSGGITRRMACGRTT